MRDRLIELLTSKICRNNKCKPNCAECKNAPLLDNDVEYLADAILADGWMRPPFTIGQTVYAVDRRSELYWKGTVSSFCHSWNEDDIGVSFEDGDFAVYHEADVFLAEEEAVKALEGGGVG